MRKVFAVVLAGAVSLTACERARSPVEPVAAVPSDADALAGAIVERTWAEGHQWELVKPRPPGIGVSPDQVVSLYIIAPVDPGNPLSPPFPFLPAGARDHVAPAPNGNGGTFRAVARSVPLHVPEWNWMASCDAPAVDETRIAWRWVVTPHPCGQEPLVYAVRLEGEACRMPLTSIRRVEAAVAAGLAVPTFPPEAPWPFAIRPLTQPAQGRVIISPPACV